MEGSCEYGNKSSGSIKVEVTDYLCDNQLFMKDSTP